MIPAALVSVEEYLSKDYSPDCDYVDGVLEDRNWGEKAHALTQTLIVVFLLGLRQAFGALVVVEQRIRVSPTRFRVPDVCVILNPNPDEEVVTTAPFLCVEVLSAYDPMTRMHEKVRDYLRMGVDYVWLVSPYSRSGWIHTIEGAVEARDGVLRTNDPVIEMPLAEVLP